MNSRVSVGLVAMLLALLVPLFPAATLGVQPAQALSTCDRAQFVADVTVPDGTKVSPGLSFTKTWRLKNTGTCAWTTAYTLVFSSGNQLGGPSSLNLPGSVQPGQTVDLSVTLTAPGTAGHYIGYWKLKNASGIQFGIGSTADKAWWVEINVTGSSEAAGVAYDFAANYCSANWYTSQGGLPCSGNDGDVRGFVIKVGQPQLENGTIDPGVGLLTVPENAYNGDIHGAFPSFRVQTGDRFQSVINCAYGAQNCDVTFRLDYQVGAGPINTFASFHEKYEGLLSRVDVDLSPLAGQDVSFILTVLATGTATGDRALWVNPVITRAGSTPPTPNARKFDFGTLASPVAPGYVRVTETTAYVPGAFGWTTASNAESRDRSSQADPLKRDFVMSGTSAPTFRVDLPNGNYAVTVTMGDNDAPHDNMVVKANGGVKLADVDTAAGTFAINTFNVAVSSGSLTVQFLDAGGVDSVWVVNGLSIAALSQPPAPCDRAQFMADVTVPDGTVFAPGTAFTKTWRLKNIGTCTWTTFYALVFDAGEKMGGPDLVNMPRTVAPGQTVDVSVNLTAPSSSGAYRGYWKFQNADGVRFGIGTDRTRSWWVDIKVSGAAATPTPTSATSTVTATPTPTTTPSTPTPTQPPANCDRAQFVADVTVPDGTVLAPGAAFTKTWRLKNVGTCPWTSSYALVFDTGAAMGGPASVSMPSVVPPGSSVDISVSLTAPGAAGSYRGYWRFQNAAGVRFGLGTTGTKSWWVDIRVSGTPATATPTTTPVTSTPVPGLTVHGYVRLADGSGLPGVTIYRSFAAYDGVVVATTDANGYFQSDFTFIPGDEMVRVWPSAAGYSFNPESAYWRHYYGPEDRTLNFVASPAAGTPTSTPSLTATPTATPTATSTPTATASATSGWSTYQNARYGFSFQFPPGSSVEGQSDFGGRVYLPFKAGTNLTKKYLDVNVAEGVSPCKSPGAKPPWGTSEYVTFNGTQFLKETWEEGLMSHRADWTSYSTAKGNACISMSFLLWSVVPEVMETPPPVFDRDAESAVFTAIMSSFVDP